MPDGFLIKHLQCGCHRHEKGKCMSKDDIKVPPKVKKPKGESKIAKKYHEVVDTTKKVINGVENLILSASLVIVSFYNIYDLLNRPVDSFEYYVRAFASLVIALVGAGAIIKVFKALGENK